MSELNNKCEQITNDYAAATIGTQADRLKKRFQEARGDRPFATDPVYECPECKDTKLVYFTDKNGYERAATCKCEIRRKYERVCKTAGFKLDGAKTIDEYQGWCETACIAKMHAKGYIQNFDTVRKKKQNWFIVYGQSGSGKTTLGRAIVKELINRPRPIAARAVKYHEMMQMLKSKSNDTDYKQLLETYTDCEVLFIDDMLKEMAQYGDLTSADRKHLFAVIDARYEAERPTIITTECTCGRIDALDEAIYGRMKENAYASIIFDNKDSNYRKRGV